MSNIFFYFVEIWLKIGMVKNSRIFFKTENLYLELYEGHLHQSVIFMAGQPLEEQVSCKEDNNYAVRYGLPTKMVVNGGERVRNGFGLNSTQEDDHSIIPHKLGTWDNRGF